MPLKVNLPSDKTLSKTGIYNKVIETLAGLESAGVLDKFKGNCVAAADLIQHLLSQCGIESRIVETQVTITYNYDGTFEYAFIGYEY